MASLFGKSWKRRELLSRGDIAQFAGIERAVLDDGPARGLRVATLRTGSGLEAQVLIDRCLDIGLATFNGAALALRSFTGDTHPAYYNPAGMEWLRTFGAGLLTTCGLSNVGAPSRDNNEEYGLHGRISNTPASNVAVNAQWRGNEYHFSVSGVMREGHLFGPKLVLHRVISSKLGANFIEIRDTITNEDFIDAPLLLLYHFNIGFPIVTDGSRLLCRAKTTTPRDAEAEKGLATCKQFEAPQVGYKEQVFYHDLTAAADGKVSVAIVTPACNQALLLEYPKKALPYFVQWKMMRQGSYVVGLEPANCHVGGRAAEREAGTMEILKPGAEKSVTLRISVLHTARDIEKIVTVHHEGTKTQR
ncbi:MAG: aldose 1-epimerase family protein [Planctomycetota bacterium]